MIDRSMLIATTAKINLGLRISHKRTDGFHEIETVMQQISLTDYLKLEPCCQSNIVFQCTDKALETDDNLVLSAARMIGEYNQKLVSGVKITLYKNVPVQAGLGGGSADAAATLKALNSYWSLGLDYDTLHTMAGKLGSDVPFFLKGGTALATGRGERILTLPRLPFFWVIIALPQGVLMSTGAVYKAIPKNSFGSPSISPLVEAVKIGAKQEIIDWLSTGSTNTLENAVLPGFKLIKAFKGRLIQRGLNPVLSGSGPALFVLADSYQMACSTARIVEEENGQAYLCWSL